MTAIHNIVSGDTLSQIAQRIGSSVSALMDANSQVRNADLIYAGDTLNIPGAVGTQGGGGAGGATGVEGVSGSRPVSGNNAAAIAEQFLGRNASDLKRSDELPMESWVPDNVNCANFVSACLQQAGLIDPGQASASVANLASNLKSDGWTTVSLSQAQPGDVVLMQRDGQSHVVLFAGMENGQPKFIGSNNVNADGTQRVSWGGASGNYEIITPPR